VPPKRHFQRAARRGHGFGVLEHRGDGSALPMLVQSDNLSPNKAVIGWMPGDCFCVGGKTMAEETAAVGTSSCSTAGQCPQLLAAAEAARQDWMTKHAASCRPGQPHSAFCNNAYAYYLAKARVWYSSCCQAYRSEKVDGAEPGFEILRAFEESKATAGK
jgi:hypothetical protein